VLQRKVSDEFRQIPFAALLRMVFGEYQGKISAGHQWRISVGHQWRVSVIHRLRVSVVHPQKADALELVSLVDWTSSRKDEMQMRKSAPGRRQESQLF